MLRFGALFMSLTLAAGAFSACGGRIDDGAGAAEVESADAATKDAPSAPQPHFDASDASSVIDATSTSPECPALALVPACTTYAVEWGDAACTVAVDPYFAQPETLKMSNMRFRQYGWADSSEQDGMLTYVGSATACAEYPYGWYFDDPEAPTQAIACATACACLKRGELSGFSFLLGCPRVSAPGVEPPGPTPLCASSRPAKCATASSGMIYNVLKCSKLGDGTLDLVDPEQINVAFHGTNADGYLSYVPSLEDCASVVEGWYFTPGKSPTEISICPSTCACALTQPPAGFEISFGCPRWSAL